MIEYYFSIDKEPLLDELIFKFIRMGFDGYTVTVLGAGTVLTIYN